MPPLVFRLLAALLFASPVLSAEDAERPTDVIVPWNVPVLLAHDLDRSAAWYQEHFDFERVSDRMDGASRSLVLSRGMTLVHLRAQAADTTGSVAEADLDPRYGLALLVDDVDAAAADLERRGVEMVAMPQDDQDGRKRTALVADPDGNLIVLQEVLPRGT